MNIDRQVSSSSRAPAKRKKRESEEVMKPMLDINTLDYYCRYVISSNGNIRTSGLNLVKELFSRVDPSTYNDPERVARIQFIKRGLEARLDKKLKDRYLIIQYINGGLLDKPLLDTDNMGEISDETLAYLNEQASELSKSFFVDDRYEKILSLASNLKNGNYVRRSEAVQGIQDLVSELNIKFNKLDDSINSDSAFSLLPGEFEDSLADTYARETSPSRVLTTGMTGLNLMLDGGFYGGRVYLLVAQAAGGKSFTMLDLAMQIKKYNKNYKTHDPTKIPTIVFLTMENSSDENISRMVGMMSNGKSFTDFTVEESCQLFRSNGMGYDPVKDPIDLYMVYKPNLSKNTDYLYTLVDKLRESGREPICVFQDHIKRIRPVNRHNDMRLDLGEIVNEFKAFANNYGIPVISDSHLNRDASKYLDESTNSNKKDLIRNLGSHNISESYLMIDNSDSVIIINKEEDSKGDHYMGFKNIKSRTKLDIEIFYQPYEPCNPIKLIEDMDDAFPKFKRTLKDEEAGMPMKSKNISRFANDILGQDDDDIDDQNGRDEDRGFFGRENMAKAKIIDGEIPIQDNYSVVGKPSAPVYPMVDNSAIVNQCMNPNPQYYQQSLAVAVPQQCNTFDDGLTDLERYFKTIDRNDPNIIIGFGIMDENGIIVSDSLDF